MSFKLVMNWIAVSALVIAGGYFVWKFTFRSAYESADYLVVESDGGIQIRDYPELLLVATSMQPGSGGNDGSFGRLFQYISGKNDQNKKVAMTTPVFMETRHDRGPDDRQCKGQMGFVIPRKIAEQKVPGPTNDQVRVRKRPAGRFGVIRFAGNIADQKLADKEVFLRQWLTDHNYKAVGEVELAGYDPPWIPGLFRRNEILIRVE